MNVLVTGGAGFIGGNFVYHMLDKHPDYKIICVDCLTYAGNMSTLEEAMKNPWNYVKATDRKIRDTYLKKYVTGNEPKPRLCIEYVDDFLQKTSDIIKLE